MADGTRAVVGTSAAERESEATAPLSTAEIAAELADGTAGSAEVPGKAGKPAPKSTPKPTPKPASAAAQATVKAAKTAAGAGTAADAEQAPEEAAEAAQAPAPGSAAEPDDEPDDELADDTPANDPAEDPAEAPEAPEAPEDAAEEPADAPSDDAPRPAELPDPLPVPTRHSGDMIADRYRLEECISQSTAFSSWRAVDEKLRRAVGVHLLAAGHQRAEDVLAAARAAALLNDPRFVQVLDAVQEGELVYVIREWLPDATDLAKLLAPGPLEPYDAYQMVRQVTDAVAAAHRRGRAHLRLTPRCVLRTDTGQYRINGVAVDAALRGLPDEDAALTDTRAIGALLYAALTHRWPFPEDRYDLEGLPKSLGCVPPDQVRAGIHRGLSDLATRALCEAPPHHLEPIRTPAELAKAIALLPKIRPPEHDSALPGLAAPRYSVPQPVAGRTAREPRPAPRPAPAPTAVRPLPAPPRPARTAGRGIRKVLKWTVAAVLLAAIGYGSWHLAGQLGHGDSQALGAGGLGTSSSAAPSSAAVTPLPIADVTSFNPFGTGPMHTELLPLTHDNDPNTSWTTDGYFSDLDTLGHGTGLLVDLGSTKSVSEVSVLFGGATKAELRVPTATGGPVPTQLSDFGNAIAQSNAAAADFRPDTAVRSRYLLIWLTGLPKDGTGRWRGQVAEIKVAG